MSEYEDIPTKEKMDLDIAAILEEFADVARQD
ncbi:unnamed protein product, partial [Allacma fusca]